MKNFYIDTYEGRHDPNRFCVKTKTGSIYLSAMQQGYHSEDSARRALFAELWHYKKQRMRKQFFKIVTDEEYAGFMRYINCRWHGKHNLVDGKFKLKYITKGREICKVDLKMGDRQFLNRYIKWKTNQKHDI